MLEKLLNLLGTSVDTQEIKDLYAEFGAKYPTKITGNADTSMLKGRVKKDGIELHFGVTSSGSKYLKPKKTEKEGTFIAMFLMIQILKNYKGDIPHGIKFNMTADELTKILGKPKEVNFMGKSFIWKKNISDKHEIKIDDSRGMDENEPYTRSIMLQYIWEDN
jgi:hypothetical protein